MNKHKIESSIISVGYLISKTELFQRLSIAKIWKDNSFNLTFEQLDLLHILYQEDNISQAQLGRVALKDKANVARIIVILEKKGFIKRKLSTQNNRMVKKVFITDNGKKEVELAMPIITKSYQEDMRGISEEQIVSLKQTLEIMRNNIAKRLNLEP